MDIEFSIYLHVFRTPEYENMVFRMQSVSACVYVWVDVRSLATKQLHVFYSCSVYTSISNMSHGVYEHYTSKNRRTSNASTPNQVMVIFVENVSNNFDLISVIYEEHFTCTKQTA
jgi:hypothetical protein